MAANLTAPTSVTATPQNGSVSLSWRPPAYDGGAPVKTYKVYRGTAPGAETLLTTVAASRLSLGDALAGMANGTAYFYKVSASNDFGEGPLSAEVTATPSAAIGKPGPVLLRSVISDGKTVTVSWDAAADNGSPVTGYRVHRATHKGAEAQPIYAKGTALTLTDTNVTPGATYFYVVKAENGYGAGPASNELQAKVGTGASPPSGPPAAPTIVKCVGMNKSVQLGWLAPPFDGLLDVATYKIFRNGVYVRAYTPDVLGTNDGIGIVNETKYTYEVLAANDYGDGPRSAPMSATPSAAIVAPQAPVLVAVTGGDTKVDLKWSAPTDTGSLPISGYNVYRGSTAGAAATQSVYAALGASVLGFTDTNVLNDCQYFYVVKAVNEVGQSAAFSNELQATPKGGVTPPPKPTAPAAPVLLGASSEASVTLSWKPPPSDGGSPVTGYKVYRSTASGQETLVASLGLVTSWQDLAVVMGAVYFYKVTAVNAVGEAPLSNEVHT